MWWAIVLSLSVHGLGGLTASRLGLAAPETRRTHIWTSSPDTPSILMDWAPAEPAEVAEAPKPPPDPLVLAEAIPPPAPKQDPLKLGIAESSQQTTNVMGFDDPTEHMARESSVDQPALELDPGGGGGELSNSPEAAMAEKLPLPPEAPPLPDQRPEDLAMVGPPTPPDRALTASPRGDSPVDREAATEVPEGDANAPMLLGDGPPVGEAAPRPEVHAAEAGVPIEQPSDGSDPATVSGQPEVGPPLPPQLQRGAPTETLEAATPVPAPEAAPAASPRSASLGSPGPVALKSDSEADPASKQKPLEIVLGRPAAGEGLRIITKRPKRNLFSTFTRVTAMPDNPVIEVQFDRSGRVFGATVTKSSGFPDVDGPLLASVYSWMAEGKRLAELGRDEVVTVVVTILLR